MDRSDRSRLRRRLATLLSGLLGCAAALVALTWLAYEAAPVANLDMQLLNRLLVVGGAGLAASWGQRIVHLGDPAAAFIVTAAACAAALAGGRWRSPLAAAVLLAGASATTLVAPARWRPLTIALGGGIALLGSFALIFLGDHFPSDVLAGWLVAGAWFFAVLAGLASAALLRRPAVSRPPARARRSQTASGG